jgi:hypothetical protein
MVGITGAARVSFSVGRTGRIAWPNSENKMKAVSNHDPHLLFTVLILGVFAELALPMMGQLPAAAPKAEPVAALAGPSPVPPPSTSGGEDPTEPTVMHLHSRSFFVDPYQFHEVVQPKLPVSKEDSRNGSEVFAALRQWFAQLGVEMNQTNGKSIFWHDDGRLLVRASSADLDTIEGAIMAMSKEYSGKPHPPLEIRVIHIVPDNFEAGLRKLKLLSEGTNSSPGEVSVAVLRRFAELGVDLTLPKTRHYDRSRGYLAVCATRADLEIIEPEVVRLQVTPDQRPP